MARKIIKRTLDGNRTEAFRQRTQDINGSWAWRIITIRIEKAVPRAREISWRKAERVWIEERRGTERGWKNCKREIKINWNC